MSPRIPILVILWFLLDLALALLPPVHWWAGRPVAAWGLPRFLVYNIGLCAFIAASVVTAYACDPSAGAGRGER